MKLLADARALRLVVYAVTAVLGAAAVIAGISTPVEVETWLDKAPAVAGTIASILAMVNLTPKETTPPAPVVDPMAEYARKLRGQ